MSRLLLRGMIGAAGGAAIGLIVFGGILLLPALFMVVGAGIGVSSAINDFDPRMRLPAKPRGGAATARGGVAIGPVRVAAPRGDLPPIDVNTADAEELTGLPGVGKAAAARIVAHRESHGTFRALGDVAAVEGFDQARVARLAVRATVSDPGAPAAKPDEVASTP